MGGDYGARPVLMPGVVKPRPTYGDLFDKFSNGHNRLLAAMGQAAIHSRCQMKTFEPWQCSSGGRSGWNLDEGERGTKIYCFLGRRLCKHMSSTSARGKLSALHILCPRSHKVSQSPCGVFFEKLVTFNGRRKASTLR